MNASDIPEFTSKILAACKQAVQDGNWQNPKSPGTPNVHCCPINCYQGNLGIRISSAEIMSFMRGYDLRLKNSPEIISQYSDYRFYILGQTFREIALTVGF